MTHRHFLSVIAALALISLSARSPAQFNPIGQPNAAYTGGTTEFTFADPDFNTLSDLTSAEGKVSFSTDLVALTVPTSWASWGSSPDTEGDTPRVLWTNGVTDVTLLFSKAFSTVGFELQPNTAGISTVTASFFSGANLLGTITRDVDGLGGALLFAANSTPGITSVTVSSADDFALARIRVGGGVATVPEAGSLAQMSVPLFAGVLALMRKRRSNERP